MTPMLSNALLRTQTDERLAALAAAGHDRAFEAIVDRYRRPLLRYLRRMLSEQLAEDVVQATFLNAWSSLRRGAEIRDLRPWLYRIAHNAAINALKKVGEALEEVPESVGGFAAEPATELERRDEVRRALDGISQLPARQRAALLAIAVDGRAHAEVAEELGLTDGAVRQLVHRARHTLRTGATAITPAPLLHFMATSGGDATVARVAEVAAGAGGAGAASMSLKAGAAAVLATGAIATGGPKVADVVTPDSGRAATEQTASTPSSSSSSNGPDKDPMAAPALASVTAGTTTSSSSSAKTSEDKAKKKKAKRKKSSSNSGSSSRAARASRAGRARTRARAAPAPPALAPRDPVTTTTTPTPRARARADRARAATTRPAAAAAARAGDAAREVGKSGKGKSSSGSSGSGSSHSGSGSSGSGSSGGDDSSGKGSGGDDGDHDDTPTITAPPPVTTPPAVAPATTVESDSSGSGGD